MTPDPHLLYPQLDTLPILPFLPEITQTVQQHPATVIIGATGSGKTTQVGLHLLRQGLAKDKRIGITQPRRLAATSVAQFVAELYGCEVGEEVGYQIRFDDATMEGTKLKFMTEGILLQEAAGDPLFSRYNVLIFDEAHEQGLNTDICLGLAKRAVAQRTDLHVVVMSATIDTGRFAEYFNDAPVITIPGRSFPITTTYLTDQDQQAAVRMFHQETPNASLPALAAYKVHQIHQAKQPGHVLIFMPGKREIAETIELVQQLGYPDLLALPAHSEMDQPEQQRIFAETTERKVVVATNIAETSITVDHLAYVIDSGLIRQMLFDHRHGIGALKTIEHSKAGLKQRMGRAGRTQPGIYLPLFTEPEYDTGRAEYLEPGQHARPDYSIPEIQRTDLASAVLRMIHVGVTDVEHFEFMNAPARGAIHNAMRTLQALGALNQNQAITPLGEQMAKLPVEPRIARMILEAERFGCLAEILTIAAALSTGTIFTRPIGQETQADAIHVKLMDKRGDLLTLLKVVPLYERQKNQTVWAERNFINQHTIEEILKIREQLHNLVTWMDIPITSLRETLLTHDQTRRDQEYAILGRAITAGLIQQLAVRSDEREYTRLDGGTMRLHPASVWAKVYPPIIVYTEIIELNDQPFAVNCQAVELAWIEELAPHLIKTHQVPLHHPWQDRVVGTYTVTRLAGVEIHRTYQKARLKLSHRTIRQHQDGVTREHHGATAPPKRRHKNKHQRRDKRRGR